MSFRGGNGCIAYKTRLLPEESASQQKSLFRNPSLSASNFLMRTLAILVLAISAFAQTATQSGNQALSVDQENARKARAIIDRGIQALGGQAYLNVKDV